MGHPAEPEPPERVGRYLLEERIASGGMGDVYRARAVGAEGVVKEVCVKRLAPEILSTRRAVDRFIEEARLSMGLGHGNVVSVFDFGRADDGYYLAMEWVDGIDLSALIARKAEASRPLSTAEVAYVGAEVAKALDHAHRSRRFGAIVHRDVKPSNVLLSRAGEVKLADFGVATMVGEVRGIAGTPAYMSPEQRQGDPVDHRTDLYSLGKVLLEMAIGKRADVSATALASLPEELETLIAQLLETNRERRPEDARSVVQALELIVSRAVAEGQEHPRERLASRVLSEAPDRKTPTEHRALTGFTSLAPTGSAETEDAPAGDDRIEVRSPSAAGTEVERPIRGGSPPVEQARRKIRWAPFGVSAAIALAVLATVLHLVDREPGGEAQITGARAGPNAAVTEAAAARGGEPPAGTGGVGAGPPPPRSAGASASPTERASRAATRGAKGPAADPASEGSSAAGEPQDDMGARPRTRPTAQSGPAARRPTASARRRARDRADARRRTEAESPPEPRRLAATGMLSVAARPWAEVFVDGERIGLTPVIGHRVSAGEHEVRLDNGELGVTRALRVRVPENGRRNLSVDLR